MNIYQALLDQKTSLSLIGLGYVGLPIAVAFSKKVNVIGFDISKEKIDELKSGIDRTGELEDGELENSTILFTANDADLKKASFHIVAVPTPLTRDNTPDLSPLESASRIVGKNLQKGSIVVFESTVYPGVTEEVCVPILEKESGLKSGHDFKVGYSPERINPGDKVHRLETIVKVVSGEDEESLDEIAKVYEMVVEAGIHKAQSIKVAEAAKVIENAQRDINIAFMNELSIIFDKMGINTKDVLDAAATKWNFLKFYPGLVGGHCIGVDPYYLTYKANQLGYQSQIISSGRKINDSMGRYIAQKTIKLMSRKKLDLHNSKIAIFGFTFKENCPDIRNTKVYDIYTEFCEFGLKPLVYDPIASKKEVYDEYGIELVEETDLIEIDVAIFAVAHTIFKNLEPKDINSYFKNINNSVIFDVKSIYKNKSEYPVIDAYL